MEPIAEITPLSDKDCIYVADRHKSEFTFPLHTHLELELNYLENADGAVRVVGDRREIIGKEDLVLISGENIEHAWEQGTCDTGDIREITIQFSRSIFSEDLMSRSPFISIRDLFDRARKGLTFSASDIGKIRGLLNELSDTKDDFFRFQKFLHILYLLSLSTEARELSSFASSEINSESRRVTKIKQYVRDHFAEELSLPLLANMVNMTPSSFSRFFQQRAGRSLADYIADVRIGHAAELLSWTSLFVSEICFQCGYNNISNFNRIFKSRKGMTPSEYRSLVQKKPKQDKEKSSGYDHFLNEVQETLNNNILNWWLGLKDARGGFISEADFWGNPLSEATRGVILNARIIWSFSAAYRHLGRKDYLLAARHAGDWFLRHFCDHRYGGVYWSVAANGQAMNRKKQLYAQAFAIYGMSELYRASNDQEALNTAIQLFRTVEHYFADPVYGGYLEALDRDFSPLEDMSLSSHDINAEKTMNSHLHLLEAYTNLYRVWPDASLKESFSSLLSLICTRMIGINGHLFLYFNRDWQVLPSPISYGHDIETSWLALESAMVLKDFELLEQIRCTAARLARSGNEGYLEDGSYRYERLFKDGSFSYDDTRQWWVQAEAIVGNLWLWKYHGDPKGLERAFACWKYVKTHFLDHEHGEWYFNILPDGRPDPSLPKAGFWKCPYHNTRMCLEVLKIFD